MTRYLIGIDNGSQSTKTTIFDEHGHVVCEGREILRPTETPRPGVAEYPDDDLWLSIGEASRHAIEAFPGDLTEIAGVGLCTIRFCRALLKEDGSLADPVLSWMDDRVSRPYQDTDPNVRYVTTSSGYLGHRMTGEFKDTAANYQGMWPISTDRWEWLRDDEDFSNFGIPRRKLFELVLPGQLLGHVTEEASRHTGIPTGVPVFATANDKAVEALGCGSGSPGTLLASLGTYAVTMTPGQQNLKGASFWSNFASVPGAYLYESTGIRRGMWTVSWWRDVLGREVSAPAELAGMTADQYLDRKAAEVPPGADGLMVTLDWLAPTEAPFKKGSILGFDVRHDRFHVHRAILEGIALTLFRCATNVGRELEASFDRLVVSGGGAGSDLVMRILADVFGLDSRRTEVPDAAGLGAAICAAVGLGLYPTWDTATDEMVRWQPPVRPDLSANALYRNIAAVYDSIPDQTDPIFERSFRLFD